MKMTAVVALCFLTLTGAALLRTRDTPDEVKLDMEYRAEDSFGNTALEPPCAKVTCGEYSCPTPFELKVDKTCCGYCWAPDGLVPPARHRVVEPNATGFAVEQCVSAPSTCRSPGDNVVRCFKPACRDGDIPHCTPGSCCAMCTTR